MCPITCNTIILTVSQILEHPQSHENCKQNIAHINTNDPSALAHSIQQVLNQQQLIAEHYKSTHERLTSDSKQIQQSKLPQPESTIQYTITNIDINTKPTQLEVKTLLNTNIPQSNAAAASYTPAQTQMLHNTSNENPTQTITTPFEAQFTITSETFAQQQPAKYICNNQNNMQHTKSNQQH
eukprot:gene3337-2319_t